MNAELLASSSVVGVYRLTSEAEAAVGILRRAGLDGRRLTVVRFGSDGAACASPVFVLARGSADVIQHARLVLAPPPEACQSPLPTRDSPAAWTTTSVIRATMTSSLHPLVH